MHPVLEELNARLDELEANIEFLAIAVTLRPRLGSVLNWNVGGEVVKLAQGFLSARASRPENLYGALLVRVLAAFERFARQLIDDAVHRTAARAKSYGDLREQIRERNTVLTGRLLASLEAPRDYLVIETKQLAENLASCASGSSSFRLNGSAFAAAVVGGSPPVLERALHNLAIDNWWDAVGGTANLRMLLGTKGTRDTSKAARARLQELWRWRNMIAHAGDEDIVLTEAGVRDAIKFVKALATALEGEVSGRLK